MRVLATDHLCQDELTYLHLADQRGWAALLASLHGAVHDVLDVRMDSQVFDNSAVDPENPSDSLVRWCQVSACPHLHTCYQLRCVINLAEIEPGCTLTMWRGEASRSHPCADAGAGLCLAGGRARQNYWFALQAGCC